MAVWNGYVIFTHEFDLSCFNNLASDYYSLLLSKDVSHRISTTKSVVSTSFKLQNFLLVLEQLDLRFFSVTKREVKLAVVTCETFSHRRILSIAPNPIENITVLHLHVRARDSDSIDIEVGV